MLCRPAAYSGRVFSFLLTLGIATLGGYLFSLAHVPLAWTIGAMVSTTVLVWIRPVMLPRATRPLAMVVLGTSFGLGFSAPVLVAVLSALPIIMAAGALIVVAGLCLTPLFARLAKLDRKSAYFCTVPGGIAVMPVLAERAGAQIAPVVFAQTIRMVMVVLTIPPAVALFGSVQDDSIFRPDLPPVDWLNLVLLFGFTIGGALLLLRLKAANPWLIGPLICSMSITALWQAPTGFPPWLVNVAQIGMGAGLGVRLTRRFLFTSGRLAVASLVSTGILLVVLTTGAVVLAAISGLPSEAVILGLAPGGTPEMVVTAATLHIGVPLVLGFHIVRMLINNLLIGPIWSVAKRLGFDT